VGNQFKKEPKIKTNCGIRDIILSLELGNFNSSVIASKLILTCFKQNKNGKDSLT